jgi:hypothetical protein
MWKLVMISSFFVQFLAIIGLIIWAASYHFKKRKSILLVQLASFIFWIAHFVLLGAYTGAALASVAALRLAVFSFKKKDNWINKPIILWAFIGVLVIATLLTASAIFSIFALIGGIFATIACWQYNPQKIRFLFIFSHASWIIYDIFVGSYGGAISEAVLGVSTIISLLRKK